MTSKPASRPIYLFDHPLVYALAGSPRFAFNLNDSALFIGKLRDLVIDWLEHTDSTDDRFDVEVVFVTLLLRYDCKASSYAFFLELRNPSPRLTM